MGRDADVSEEVNVVLVDGEGHQAIVPAEGGDRLLPVPADSVTLTGIRRAARRVRAERRQENGPAIAEATIGPKRAPSEGCLSEDAAEFRSGCH